jgi:hypothetical protein
MKLILIGLLASFTLIGSPALAVEEPKFTLAIRDGPFEIRDYQAAVVAEVTVTGDGKPPARASDCSPAISSAATGAIKASR